MPWLIEHHVVSSEGRAYRAASIAGCRLNPDVVEDSFPQKLSIGHAVQRYVDSQAEIPLPCRALDVLCELYDNVFGDCLNRSCKIHMPLRKLALWIPGWPAEKRIEPAICHGQAGAVVEVPHVEMEGPIFLDINEVLLNKINVARLSVRRQAHDFVLARVDFESCVVSKGRVQEPQRVREANFFLYRELIVTTGENRSCDPFAHSIHGQDRSFFERRGKEGGCSVAEMVLGKTQPLGPIAFAKALFQSISDHRLLKQFVLKPNRKRCCKASESSWGKREIGLEYALKLEERLVVEDDVINLLWPQAG